MKFAIAALLATTSAIRIGSQGKDKCVTKKMARTGFKDLDTDGSGFLSHDEIKVGIEELAGSLDYDINKDQWAWIQKEGDKIDTKTPGEVNNGEFHTFANAVFRHFEICGLVEDIKCVGKKQAAKVFKKLDTNKDGSLSHADIKDGIEELAESALNHTVTPDQWAWIKETGKKIDKENSGQVDEEEFFRFSNAVFRHFDLCGLAREARKCVTEDQAAAKFEELDTNKPYNSLSHEEIKVGIEDIAKSLNHTMTQDQWAWIQETGAKIDKKNKGEVNKKEFFRFVNAAFRHFKICNLAKEERAEEEVKDE